MHLDDPPIRRQSPFLNVLNRSSQMAVTTSPNASMSSSSMHAVAAVGALGWVSLVLMIIGSLNWGLVGVANFDLVAAIFGQGSILSRIVYSLVGLAGLYGIALALRLGRRTV
jgi:uncharacterized protein